MSQHKPEEKLIPYNIVPEIYVLVGIIIFLVSSFITHFYNVSELFGPFLSGFLTLLYQIIALIGLGQMFFLNFVYPTGIEVRVVLSFIYLVSAVVNMAIFIVLTVKRSEYLSYYFRFTFASGPLFLLRVMDAISEVKDPFVRLLQRNTGR